MLAVRDFLLSKKFP